MNLATNMSDRVLYVDNDPERCQAVSYALLNRAGVETFDSAEQALTRLKNNPKCDVVIVWLGRPGFDTFEFLRSVHKLYPLISVIAVHDLPDNHEQVIRAREDSSCFAVQRTEDFFIEKNLVKVVSEASKECARRLLASLRKKHSYTIQKRLRNEGAVDVSSPTTMSNPTLIVTCLLAYLDMSFFDQLLLQMSADYYDIGRRVSGDPERARQASVRILKGLEGLQEILEAARDWREHWNGAGPQGKCAGEIPVFARIIAVVDEFVHLITGNGVQEESVSVPAALQGIEAESGRRFDPEVVRVFVLMVEEKMRSQKPADFSRLFLGSA